MPRFDQQLPDISQTLIQAKGIEQAGQDRQRALQQQQVQQHNLSSNGSATELVRQTGNVLRQPKRLRTCESLGATAPPPAGNALLPGTVGMSQSV